VLLINNDIAALLKPQLQNRKANSFDRKALAKYKTAKSITLLPWNTINPIRKL